MHNYFIRGDNEKYHTGLLFKYFRSPLEAKSQPYTEFHCTQAFVINVHRPRFFRCNRPGDPHPVSIELENSGIRVAVGDCSVTERRRWRPPYQTGKTVHVHAKHYKHNEDGRTAPGVCGNGSVPLSHSGHVVTRIGIHTYTHPDMTGILLKRT